MGLIMKTFFWSALCADFLPDAIGSGRAIDCFDREHPCHKFGDSRGRASRHVWNSGAEVGSRGRWTNPVLSVHDLTFAGNGIVPINKTGTANKADVAHVQPIIDNAFVGPIPVQQSDLTATQQG